VLQETSSFYINIGCCAMYFPCQAIIMDSSTSKAVRPTIERKRARKALQHRQPYFCGNYHGYYNKRKKTATNDDSRLALFKRDWLEGRNILDIGCNSGDLTIAIGKYLEIA